MFSLINQHGILVILFFALLWCEWSMIKHVCLKMLWIKHLATFLGKSILMLVYSHAFGSCYIISYVSSCKRWFFSKLLGNRKVNSRESPCWMIMLTLLLFQRIYSFSVHFYIQHTYTYLYAHKCWYKNRRHTHTHINKFPVDKSNLENPATSS